MSSWLSWGFVFSMLLCFDYFRVSGMGWLIRSKARRWVGVGLVSVGTVISVAAEYWKMRVRVARCVSRPRKLCRGWSWVSRWREALALAWGERVAGAAGVAGAGGCS